MQAEYLARLSASLQELVVSVETNGRVVILVEQDATLNNGGPLGEGNLAVELDRQPVRLFVPTNGYFPEGAVRHEVLHVRRFHVDGVPQLVPGKEDRRDRNLAEALVGIDNALEHLVIVPEELRFHPERRDHWEAVLADVWSSLHDQSGASANDRFSGACMHWTFLRHVLPDSPLVAVARNDLKIRGQFEQAEDFSDRMLSSLGSKRAMVEIFFDTFTDISISRAALNYFNGLPREGQNHGH